MASLIAVCHCAGKSGHHTQSKVPFPVCVIWTRI